MSDPQPTSRRRFKTRNGCLRCKQRRIKCDETLPVCNQCTRKRFECPGYKRPLKWSSKYEVGRSGNNSAVLSSSEQVLQRIEPVQPLRPILFQSTVPDDATRSLPVQTDVQPAQNETAVGSDQASISAANSSPPKDIWIPSTMVGPDMLERAKAIEDALQSYRTLSIHQIEDTADSRTPVDHLQRIASIYRLVGLLQLYMTFPELHGAHSVDFSLTHSILGLATNVLTTIGVLPHTSGVYCLLTIPLIIAGSALQLPCFSSDVPTSMLQQDTYLFWRNFVRERVKTVQEIVGLVTIGRAQKILDKVWFLADMRRAAEDPDQEWEYIQWTEVMSSENLESIFG
ncbi:transcriptional regulator family: Fungal Specific TF [Aspergillus niger]|nr:transcriptional regulator family: Fungal Specific TF [Aspergillus niger]KAI2857004.1 transcriptional regulator family: Fungal Specific TF [Aspergillus niger]KAI2873146.1 transcriptional regulator family: Fungal Specific TF [Aspergillus niger]KAI2877672.1 transcriptional regulator family: Fungal Specific TF [Aspergillus niger]KAI2889206.1 transcriptional regulator family: Fungal Specific TF [Aspergillus niger]